MNENLVSSPTAALTPDSGRRANLGSLLNSCLVAAPPAFIKKPPTFVEVLLGDSLTLSCGAHGNPRPTVVWHKDDGQILKHEKIKVS